MNNNETVVYHVDYCFTTSISVLYGLTTYHLICYNIRAIMKQEVE